MIYWLYRLLSAGKGADMNYYNASGQMNLSDRIAIETGICIGESFKKTAKKLRRHPSTIAHEVKYLSITLCEQDCSYAEPSILR